MQAYAVVKAGGKQYSVKAGDIINVEVMPNKDEGDSLDLPTLAVSNGEKLVAGTPELDERVKATVLKEGRGKKILVFKNHRRQQYRKKNGHRQNFHAIRIDSIPAQ